jgi:hypothetical protein
MADYSPPTLADLWALIGRDLTDPTNNVFNTSQLTDYINGGISELNRVKPLPTTVTVVYDSVGDAVPLDGIPLDEVFQVELIDDTTGVQRFVPHVTTGTPMRDGWEYFNHRLYLGPGWLGTATLYMRDNGWNLHLFGYRPRDPLIDDTDVAEFGDLNDEYTVRLYARMEALRSLNSDRTLFQQWQQQANNSDISPTQLNQMLGTAEGSFDRQQKRVFMPRRIPSY